MTKNEIIEMAKQTQMPFYWRTGEITYLDKLEAFAKLVAQHEREACAYWAGIALLGADRDLANRVDQAIRARNET
jgi:hypothetical protein